jgi:hypothetical protein
VQHGINGRREQRQISEPRDATIRENASNPLHLIRRKTVSFADRKTFVPGLPFGQDSFLRGHRFSFLPMVQAAPLILKPADLPRAFVNV